MFERIFLALGLTEPRNLAQAAWQLRFLQRPAPRRAPGLLQGGEGNVGARTPSFIEIGTGDGHECNSRYWRALHGWRQKATTLAAAGQLLTSAALRWSASGRGGAFAHWRARARARSVAWRGAVRPTRSRLQP